MSTVGKSSNQSMEELIESLDEQDKELIGFIETKVASGGNNIVALRLNKEVNEELRECLLDTYIFLRQKNVSDISLGMVFEAHSDPKTEVLVSRPLGDKLEKQYEDEFNLLVLYDKDAPEEIKNKISDKIWGRKPLAMQNAAYLRDCAEKYLKYKKLCADKLGVRYHISVPEFCAVIGVPTWEWVEYETEGQIKDVKDFFTNLVLAQGSATLQDPYMKNPIGVMKVLQNFAGFKDQSELKVLQKEKRRVIINRHSREKKKQEQG